MEGRIEKQWITFKEACFPPDLSKQQSTDLKRTFYGGAAGFLNAMTEVTVSEMETEDLLSEVTSELLTFNQDVKDGRS